jgi:hypothetical protein
MKSVRRVSEPWCFGVFTAGYVAVEGSDEVGVNRPGGFLSCLTGASKILWLIVVCIEIHH